MYLIVSEDICAVTMALLLSDDDYDGLITYQ